MPQAAGLATHTAALPVMDVVRLDYADSLAGHGSSTNPALGSCMTARLYGFCMLPYRAEPGLCPAVLCCAAVLLLLLLPPLLTLLPYLTLAAAGYRKRIGVPASGGQQPVVVGLSRSLSIDHAVQLLLCP